MDRRTSIKWMLGAAASLSPLGSLAFGKSPSHHASVSGYGTDPKLLDPHRPGELWPLTLTQKQRRLAAVLSDLIIPADDVSPSASSVGVVDFIEEWISAPYEHNREDRALVLGGFKWLDATATKRFGNAFAATDESQQKAICDDVCYEPNAKPALAKAAKFFARYRDLTAAGFYTTPVGRKDLQYVGNVALANYDGPPVEALKKAGLA